MYFVYYPHMKKILFTLCALTLISACGKSSNESSDQTTESTTMKYQYIVNGCDTGEHVFNSKKAYCDGLKNDKLNNGCAESSRRDTYRDECSEFGSFDA